MYGSLTHCWGGGGASNILFGMLKLFIGKISGVMLDWSDPSVEVTVILY